MDEKDREILRDIQAMTEENNKILRKMNRRAIFSSISSFIYWIAIIAIALGGYYFIQPYLTKATDLYKTVNSSVNSNLKTMQSITDTVNKVIPVK